MRIYIKTDDGKKFHIPLPMWAIKLGLSKPVISMAAKHIKDDDLKYLDAINFDALSGCIGELKEYKGLNIVDIKSSDGTEVNITV